MKVLLRTLFFCFILISQSSFVLKKADCQDSIRNNVFKELKDDLLVNFIFVDTKTTTPWTDLDIWLTLGSIDFTVNLFMPQAQLNNNNIPIRTNYFKSTNYTTNNLIIDFGEKKAIPTIFMKQPYPFNKGTAFISIREIKDIYTTTKDVFPEIKNLKNDKIIKLVFNSFSDEIMQYSNKRNFKDLSINNFSKHLIEWRSELEPEYITLLTNKDQNIH